MLVLYDAIFLYSAIGRVHTEVTQHPWPEGIDLEVQVPPPRFG